MCVLCIQLTIYDDMRLISICYLRVVCSSTSNISTKYDPDLLKSDVAHARERVTRLKRELEQINVEMSCTRRGVETLSKYVHT